MGVDSVEMCHFHEKKKVCISETHWDARREALALEQPLEKVAAENL